MDNKDLKTLANLLTQYGEVAHGDMLPLIKEVHEDVAYFLEMQLEEEKTQEELLFNNPIHCDVDAGGYDEWKDNQITG